MWSPLLQPGLTLLHGDRRLLRGFHQMLAHHTVHHHPGVVLWCDGDHGVNPYDFAEQNMEQGYSADDGATRVLVKRCMTPFQWDTVLTAHLAEKLDALEGDVSLVLATPFDRLFSTDELKDWEQEDYVRIDLEILADLARTHDVPILLSVDMNRWWRTHPTLAALTHEAVQKQWHIRRPEQCWHATDGTVVLEEGRRRQRTLAHWLPRRTERPQTPPALPVTVPTRPASSNHAPRPLRPTISQGGAIIP